MIFQFSEQKLKSQQVGSFQQESESISQFGFFISGAVAAALLLLPFLVVLRRHLQQAFVIQNGQMSVKLFTFDLPFEYEVFEVKDERFGESK